jgi:hypothetical protein
VQHARCEQPAACRRGQCQGRYLRGAAFRTGKPPAYAQNAPGQPAALDRSGQRLSPEDRYCGSG